MLKSLKLYLSKRKWLRISLQLFFALLIFLAISFWQTRSAASGAAPPFIGSSLTGQQISLDMYSDKPLLVHFWATWCPICTLEQNTLSRLSKNSDTKDYRVLTIASWSGDAAEIAQFMKNENLEYTVVVDTDGSIAKLYGVQGVPSSFVIDSTGAIQFVEQGYTTEIGLRLRLWWVKNR